MFRKVIDAILMLSASNFAVFSAIFAVYFSVREII